MPIVLISDALLLRATATDGRILRDRVLCGFGVRLNSRKRTFLIATSVSGKQFRMTIHIMAAFAEHEARLISERTRDALAAAKARGVVLGATAPANLKPHTRQRQDEAKAFNARLKPVLSGFIVQGLSRRSMVGQLNDLGIKAPRG